MFAFKQVFASVLLAVLCASAVMAAPYSASSKYATHSTHEISPGIKLEVYHPESTYETFGEGIDHPLSRRADSSPEEAALAFVQSRQGIDASQMTVQSSSQLDVSRHVYIKQMANSIPFANAVANVALNNENKVVAYGNSFVKASRVASSTPSVSVADAVAAAEAKLGGTYDADNFPAPKMEYVAKNDGSVVLTHTFQVRNKAAYTWYQAFVDAHSGELVSIYDFRAEASYYVLPIQKETPPEGLETLVDPENLASSPDGWHSDGTSNTTTTSGNNAIAFVGSMTNLTSESDTGLVFDYPPDFTTSPSAGTNPDSARVNAFYIVNTVHDIMYQYGFTESSFNFQQNNFGNGGAGNDRVQITVQSTSGTDNAFFYTPPDGQSGEMTMWLWDLTSPLRDGALENDIVAHENTHGLTNRMTGGGTGACLGTTEAQGMGEGWSDAFADWTHQTSAPIVDFVLGQWVINDPAGIRMHPYSTNSTTNPFTYASITEFNEVHDIGEIWANILHNVHAALVDANGFSDTAFTDSTGTAGNVVFLHVFTDALALQPCQPTFVTGRDAWIQAEQTRYGGANRCTLWKAFASRGLGVNAANHVDDSTIPDDC